jgi:hypothetical protein
MRYMPEMIRRDVLESLKLYAERGIEPGGFLTAVLENNLKEAVGRADEHNSLTLSDIVSFVYNHLPSVCWGSPDAVDRWTSRDNVDALANQTSIVVDISEIKTDL